MILWRISRHRDLSGIGSLKAAGRWHHAGRSIVYLAEAPAAALLKVCVHTSANDVPPEFTLLKIEGPDLMCRQSKLTSCPRLADSARSDARPGNGMAGEERQHPTASSECDCS
jgi:RES domain-containing protein